MPPAQGGRAAAILNYADDVINPDLLEVKFEGIVCVVCTGVMVELHLEFSHDCRLPRAPQLLPGVLRRGAQEEEGVFHVPPSCGRAEAGAQSRP